MKGVPLGLTKRMRAALMHVMCVQQLADSLGSIRWLQNQLVLLIVTTVSLYLSSHGCSCVL
jgi:hypothetical protein